MNDLETLRRAQLLLGQYGFLEEQEAVAKAVRIISTTARRLGMSPELPRRATPAEAPGERLRRLREAAGLTRGQMAQQCDMALNTVRSHENGQAPVSPEAAHVYARVLGASPSMILQGFD
jgi:DNA-binding XRE family transcriptional regulator